MEKLSFKALFFRFYDQKIADGTITFSNVGISKDDFTKLCTEPDFIPSEQMVKQICENMKLSEEERALLEAATKNNLDNTDN